ncbi:MAG: hypothetical protein RBR86_00075 [Pseudobdellovibrionaceae bacterium]|jgi:hypothetical protein|nr:hypothetical protein [Pseudobdellovibrionaceae bacterium]
MSDNADNTEEFPLFMICVDADQHDSSVFHYACTRAIKEKARIGLFKTMEVEEFQSWASVEDTMKQELREQGERDLWQIAGHIRETYNLIPEFYIEEGNPVEALGKLSSDINLSEVIVSTGKDDLSEYLDMKRLKKAAVPFIFMPDQQD